MDTFVKFEALFKFIEAEMSEVLGGLSYADYLILKELVQSEVPQTPSLLARAANKVPTSFTPILDKLEKRKLIRRQPNKHDRRSVVIKLVNKSKVTMLIAELEPKVEAVLTKYLTPEERAFISSLHMKMYPVD